MPKESKENGKRNRLPLKKGNSVMNQLGREVTRTLFRGLINTMKRDRICRETGDIAQAYPLFFREDSYIMGIQCVGGTRLKTTEAKEAYGMK